MPRTTGLRHRRSHPTQPHPSLCSRAAATRPATTPTWCEVPDADGSETFKEAGDPHDSTLAQHLRAIHAAGDTRHPTALYEASRGHKPSTRALPKSHELINA